MGVGELVVHEVWYPGWEVEVDGRPGRMEIPADKVSWRVAVPEGARRAEFRFVPADFRIGLYLTLASLLFGAIILSMRKKTTRLKPAGKGR